MRPTSRTDAPARAGRPHPLHLAGGQSNQVTSDLEQHHEWLHQPERADGEDGAQLGAVHRDAEEAAGVGGRASNWAPALNDLHAT